ncbi:MAG: hypothetical protein K2X47_19680 [Bdellovibrionales bacterium]|nr:hypothetical protein [Bdellovibrionales bacterium]
MNSDLKSSLVTFLVALPLCLGIALASQAPIASGLIAGIVGGLVIGFLSGSQLSVSGPAAGLAVIVASSIQQLGSFSAFTTAVALSGIFQILFSLVKAGRLGSFFPSSVIRGMLAAIGLVLILKQIPHIIGFDEVYMGSESFDEREGSDTFHSILRAISSPDLACLIISILSFSLMFFWDRLVSTTGSRNLAFIPSPLLAVVLGVVVNAFVLPYFGLAVLDKHLVTLPFDGGLQSFVSALSFPSLEVLKDVQVYTVALTISIVGSIESLLSLDAADKIDPEKRISPKNRELFAQGVGNTISGIIGGLPLTAVIVRTSANINGGAKTKASAIFHGVWLLLAILLFPNVLGQIPLATLAVILILVGYKLTKPGLYVKTYREGLDQFLPFIVTVIAILLTDLLKGICIGMLVGFFFVIKRNLHESIVMVHDQGDYLIRFMKDVSFLQKDKLSEIFQSIPSGSRVFLDGSQDVFVDADIIGLIQDFIDGSANKKISVELKKSSTALSPYFNSAVEVARG